MNRVSLAIWLCPLLVACAAPLEDAESTENGLAEQQSQPDLLAENCTPPRCPLMRLQLGFTEIHAKLDSLDQELFDAYFAITDNVIATTPDGAAQYQWFSGDAGRGAIYNVRKQNQDGLEGTFYIYGAVLEEWARYDFERGYGYAKDPQVNWDGLRQEFGFPMEVTPSIANGGHMRTRNYLVWHTDGSVENVAEKEYLDSNSPNAPVLYPQKCTLNNYSFPGDHPVTIRPEVSFDGFKGNPNCGDCFWVLWCGADPPPPGRETPNI